MSRVATRCGRALGAVQCVLSADAACLARSDGANCIGRGASSYRSTTTSSIRLECQGAPRRSSRPALCSASGAARCASSAHACRSQAGDGPLTHINKHGEVYMVDTSEKKPTTRTAVAEAVVVFPPDSFATLRDQGVPKGDVMATARVAGVMAAKGTANVIPMCHPVQLAGTDVRITMDEPNNAVVIQSEVRCVGPTGVEMEALVSASTAALTVYDMCKSLTKGIVIKHVRLLSKTGGKSGTWLAGQQ
ncbi:unnamed protein product [Pedinophyceae sp. YPF-701]|nr:unnamed protein product [Pedinophyceae sp. YPF-701]